MIPTIDHTIVTTANKPVGPPSTASANGPSDNSGFGDVLRGQDMSAPVDGAPQSVGTLRVEGGNNLHPGGKNLPEPAPPGLEIALIAIGKSSHSKSKGGMPPGSVELPDLVPDPILGPKPNPLLIPVYYPKPGPVPNPLPELLVEQYIEPSIERHGLESLGFLSNEALIDATNPQPFGGLAAGQLLPPVESDSKLFPSVAVELQRGSAPLLASDTRQSVPLDFANQRIVDVPLAGAQAQSPSSVAEGLLESFEHLPGSDSSAVKTSLPNSPLIGGGPVPTAVQVDHAGALKLAGGPTLMSPTVDGSWGSEFAGRVSLVVKSGVQEANIQLSPAELGRLEIKITTEGDQAKILFLVQNGAARDAIDQAMPRLREMLAQDGLQLAHSEVHDQSRSHQRDSGTPTAFEFDTVADLGDEGSEATQLDVAVLASDSTVDYYI